MSYPLQNKRIIIRDLGLMDYQQAWDYQETLFNDIIQQKMANRDLSPDALLLTENYLLFCEHPHVYTLGKSGKETHLLADTNTLDAQHASYYKINRGGDITYHGPGQLVVYPILDLDNFFTDIHKYLRYLEEAVIQTLADFGIKGDRMDGLTGVWIDQNTSNPRKICAMGVRSSRWVVMHGLALNVNTELTYFNHIVPCGISDKAVTSMQAELQNAVPMQDVKTKLQHYIMTQFGMTS